MEELFAGLKLCDVYDLYVYHTGFLGSEGGAVCCQYTEKISYFLSCGLLVIYQGRKWARLSTFRIFILVSQLGQCNYNNQDQYTTC